jgi:hypothetical protein
VYHHHVITHCLKLTPLSYLHDTLYSVNDQCKGPGDAADVRGKVPSRAEYVVSDYTTVKETGAQVRDSCVERCASAGDRLFVRTDVLLVARLSRCFVCAYFAYTCTLLGANKAWYQLPAGLRSGIYYVVDWLCCFLCYGRSCLHHN